MSILSEEIKKEKSTKQKKGREKAV